MRRPRSPPPAGAGALDGGGVLRQSPRHRHLPGPAAQRRIPERPSWGRCPSPRRARCPRRPREAPSASRSTPAAWTELRPAATDRPRQPLGPTSRRCQQDYAYKVGLALAAKTGLAALADQAAGKTPANPEAVAIGVTLASNIPFQLTEDPARPPSPPSCSTTRTCIQVVDGHIARVLETLEEVGLQEDTLVVFMSDHGEYGGAHGMMMEKWHAAYQEALHVPVVFRHPFAQRGLAPRQVDALTSHVDMAAHAAGPDGHPGASSRASPRRTCACTGRAALRGRGPEPGGARRTPTSASRTARSARACSSSRTTKSPSRCRRIGDPHSAPGPGGLAFFCKVVDVLRTGRTRASPAPSGAGTGAGPVRQPNHIRCVRSGAWKLARYFDPYGVEADQWELCDPDTDPLEAHNLLAVNGPFPQLAPTVQPSRRTEVEAKAAELGALLARYEKEKLAPWPS